MEQITGHDLYIQIGNGLFLWVVTPIAYKISYVVFRKNQIFGPFLFFVHIKDLQFAFFKTSNT